MLRGLEGEVFMFSRSASWSMAMLVATSLSVCTLGACNDSQSAEPQGSGPSAVLGGGSVTPSHFATPIGVNASPVAAGQPTLERRVTAAPQALVYGPSYSGGSCAGGIPYGTFTPTPGSPASPCAEVQSLQSQGYTVTVSDSGGSAPAWNSLSTAQFAGYQLLVFADPTCNSSNFAEAVGNESTWTPAITGNIFISGADPVFHEQYAGNNPDPAKLLYEGLAYAGALGAGTTGLYLDLGCDYVFGGESQQILNGIEAGFTLGGGSANQIHITSSPAFLSTLTDTDLSYMNYSAHAWFTAQPADFTTFALAIDANPPSGYPTMVYRNGAPPAPPSISPSTLSIAPHGTQTFTCSGGSGNYKWSFAATGSGSPTLSVTTGATTKYTAGAGSQIGNTTDQLTCLDTTTTLSATVTITVTPAITVTSAPTSTYPLGSTTLTAVGGTGDFTNCPSPPCWVFTSQGSGVPNLSPQSGSSVTYSAGGGSTSTTSDTVQVTDSNGNTGTVSISVGPKVTITPTSGSTPPMGSLPFTGNGGSGSYTWAVSTGPGTSGSPGTTPTTSTAGNPVTYTAGATGSSADTVTVTDVNSGQTASASVSVGGGIAITPANPPSPPRGSIPFSAIGGSGTGYVWSITVNGSGGTIDMSTGAYVAGSVGSTTDTIQVKDSLNNTATTKVTVGPAVSISPASATVAPQGTMLFSASGGSGTGFSWSMKINSSGGNIVGGAYKAGPVGGGTDVIQVVDSLGNVATANVAVTAALSLTPTSPSSPPRGTISFIAQGGFKPYKFSLQTNGSGGTINSTTGLYVAGSTGNTTDTVVVTDANSATASAIVSVTAGITISPASPSTPPGGTIAFKAIGGSGSGYLWTVTNAKSGGSISPSTGVYTAGMTGNVTDVVHVTDSLGNTATVSISVGGGIAIAPNSPTVPPRGSQTFTATGGSGSGYTFKLTANPSGGSVTIAGAYTAGATGNRTDVIQVTDSLGNTASTNIQVGASVTITPATASTAPLGTVSFAASGGSGAGYTFSLSTNASAGKVDPTTGKYTAGPNGNVTDVVLVTDSLGNSATATVAVTTAIAISPTSANVPPRGGLTFKATGGTGTYAFVMQTNASGGSVTVAGVYTAGPTPNVIDVIGVADTNGATATAQVTVGPGVSISPLGPSVAPAGMVQFSATGGSGTGFTFTLSKNNSGGVITATGAYTAGLTGKTVDTVLVTDSLGNTASTSVSVGGALAINPTMPTTPPLGTVTFTAVGGTAPYVFKLATNASGGTTDTAGHYTAGNTGSVTDVVTVTDSTGATASANVSVGPGVTVTPATATVTTGTMVPFAVAGGSGMGYAWEILPNQSGGTINASTGVYTAGSLGGVTDTVVAKDSLGNFGTATVTVKGNPMMGGDGGVEGGTTDGGGGMDSGSKMDGGAMDAAQDGTMSGSDSGSGEDSGQMMPDTGTSFEAGEEGGTGAGATSSNSGCGCTTAGGDTSALGSLGALAFGLAFAVRRRRRG